MSPQELYGELHRRGIRARFVRGRDGRDIEVSDTPLGITGVVGCTPDQVVDFVGVRPGIDDPIDVYARGGKNVLAVLTESVV